MKRGKRTVKRIKVVQDVILHVPIIANPSLSLLQYSNEDNSFLIDEKKITDFGFPVPGILLGKKCNIAESTKLT
jgi:hypothetical protein